MFASPGGGYSRGYYDLPAFRGELYSEAEHHTAQGIIFIAYDHLGVGDSSCPDEELTISLIAAANDAAIREMVGMIEGGTLSPRLPPLGSFFKIGIGQSMGGAMTIVMQGAHGTFDAIIPLASSAIHPCLPQRSPEADRRSEEGWSSQGSRDVPRLRDAAELAQYIADYVYPFFWDDVPAEIINADQAGGFPVRRQSPSWGSKTIPRCASLFMTRGCIAAEAAAVTVPVLVCVGERDTCPEPRAEPTAFARATDVSVFMVPKMAHMHNFASTRRILWERIVGWSRFIAKARSTDATVSRTL